MELQHMPFGRFSYWNMLILWFKLNFTGGRGVVPENGSGWTIGDGWKF